MKGIHNIRRSRCHDNREEDASRHNSRKQQHSADGQMDELDDELFGTTSRAKSTKPISSSGTKKSVLFDDFNEDDPLADLLSDEDDFQPNPVASGSDAKRNLVSDLFGIKSSTDSLGADKTPKVKLGNPLEVADNKVTVTTLDDWIGPPTAIANKKVTEEVQRARPAVTSSSEEVGLSVADKIKKSSLMEDLFGSRPKTDPSKEKLVGLEMSEVQKKSELLSKPSSTGYAPTVSAQRESRRGRRSSSGIVDPLGMFSTPEISGEQTFEANLAIPKEEGTGKSVELPPQDLPEWLGGLKKSNDSTHPQPQKHSAPIRPNPELRKETVQNPANQLPDYSERFSALAGTEFDQQAMMMSLQQQEHELRTAATLSKQSEQLNKMIESQRNRLNDQEKQFNVLIKRQIDRQELLEGQMKAQQDRINSHLQLLLAQPTSVPMAASIVGNEATIKGTDEERKDLIEFSSIVAKLEAEKMCFENILDRLKDQHAREIGIIEESYTRQIEMMGQGMERLEKRLRQDIELVGADYEARIQKLREEGESMKIAHGEEIANLKKENLNRIKEIQEQQHRNMELVQNEYIEAIENIGKAKDIERQTISKATGQTEKLTETLEIMKVTMSEIKELKIKLENNNDESNRNKEILLKHQVEELKDLKEYLKKQHQDLEAGRSALTEATRRLDGGALKLISEFDRHNKENIEAESRLKSREETLVRDKELLQEQIKWERNHIQAMKETWIKEQERQARQLAEERNNIAAEKAKLETLQKLKLEDNDTAKAELEAALSTARDAANVANRERQKWRERLNELEARNEKIKDKENSLTLRAKELQDLTQAAFEKREEGLRALKEARFLEEQHKAYLVQLQIQSEALSQRENKIATEKLALARDRLALRISQTDKPEKDTGNISGPVSYAGDQHSHYPLRINDLPDSQMTTTHFKDIVDPQLVLLKLGLDNELDVSNDCLGTMQTVFQ